MAIRLKLLNAMIDSAPLLWGESFPHIRGRAFHRIKVIAHAGDAVAGIERVN